MAPILHDGDHVEVRSAAVYWPGDILLVKGAGGSSPTVHRLLGWVWLAGWSRYLTQADNAPKPDAAWTREQVIGKVSRVAEAGARVGIPLTTRIRSLFLFLRHVTGRLIQNNGLR